MSKATTEITNSSNETTNKVSDIKASKIKQSTITPTNKKESIVKSPAKTKKIKPASTADINKKIEPSNSIQQVKNSTSPKVESTPPKNITPVQKSNRNGQKPKSNNERTDGFVSMGKRPNSQLYATRKLPITNRIIHTNLHQFSIIGHNTAAINGGLLRYRAFEGVEPFEKYIQLLIENVNQSILSEITECQTYLSQYGEQGYEFFNESEPSICEVKLYNATSNLLIQMYLFLDTLLTNFNFLEKCNHISSSEKMKLERQWSSLPKEINHRILSVREIIEKKLEVNFRNRNSDKKIIDTSKINALFKQFQDNKAEISLTHIVPIPEMKNNYKIANPKQQKLA